MELVSPRRRPVNSQLGVVTRGSEPGHAFSHLHPVAFILLGILLLGTSMVALVQTQGSGSVFGAIELSPLVTPEHRDPIEPMQTSTKQTSLTEASTSNLEETTAGTTSASVSTNIVIEASTQPGTEVDSSATSSVIVDGEHITIPDTGQFKHVVKDGDSVTSIETRIQADHAKVMIKTKGGSSMSSN